MATLLPIRQQFTDLSNNALIGIHVLKLASASDTFTVPNLADTTSGASVKQLERSGDATVTVTNSGNTVTIAGGAAGNEVLICSVHAGNQNQIDEA
jgi:uncharacterized heparinase superfamily protein